MKSKKSLYLLLPAAILLWGYIIFKVIAQTGSNTVHDPKHKVVVGDVEHTQMMDTFKLILNYRDPFLGKAIADKPDNVPIRVPQPVKKEAIPKKNTTWPIIAYSGKITNKKSNKEVYLLTVGDKSCAVSPGQNVNGVTVVKLLPDSIILQYEGEKRAFAK